MPTVRLDEHAYEILTDVQNKQVEAGVRGFTISDAVRDLKKQAEGINTFCRPTPKRK